MKKAHRITQLTLTAGAGAALLGAAAVLAYLGAWSDSDD